MNSSLSMATADGLKSIAFPSIGTGNLQFPRALVAQTMFDEVKAFSRASPQTSITTVLFVIHERDVETLNVSAAIVAYFLRCDTVISCVYYQ